MVKLLSILALLLTLTPSVLSAQENNANSAKGLFNQAQTLLGQGRIKEAITTLQAMAKAYPTYPESYNNLAVIYANQGEVGKAVEMLNKTLDVAPAGHPTTKISHRNLANIYLHLAQDHLKRLSGFADATPQEKQRLQQISAIIGQDVWGDNPTQSPPSRLDTTRSNKVTEPKSIVSTSSAVDEDKEKVAVDSQKKAIIRSLYEWRNAWMGKNINHYFGQYKKDYFPEQYGDRASWEKSRQERILGAGHIELNLREVGIKIDSPTQGSVIFKQTYASGDYKDETAKKLTFELVDDRWLIASEESI